MHCRSCAVPALWAAIKTHLNESKIVGHLVRTCMQDTLIYFNLFTLINVLAAMFWIPRHHTSRSKWYATMWLQQTLQATINVCHSLLHCLRQQWCGFTPTRSASIQQSRVCSSSLNIENDRNGTILPFVRDSLNSTSLRTTMSQKRDTNCYPDGYYRVLNTSELRELLQDEEKMDQIVRLNEKVRLLRHKRYNLESHYVFSDHYFV